MKHSSIIFLAVMLVLNLNSCREVETKEGVTMPMQNDTHLGNDNGNVEQQIAEDADLDDGQETGDAVFENELLATLYEQYSEIKSALVNSNVLEAKEAAEALVEAIEEKSVGESAIEPAQKIATSDELDIQKVAFADLSAAVEDIVSGALVSGEIYKQYCPMAFSGEGGYWLSSSKEVRNPYFGDKMLKCGRVAETIQ